MMKICGHKGDKKTDLTCNNISKEKNILAKCLIVLVGFFQIYVR